MSSPTEHRLDAVELEIIKASLDGIVQEMQNSLFRTGFSTIIRESQDASCAIMNPQGDVIAQHVVLPLHIGAFPACCGAVMFGFDACSRFCAICGVCWRICSKPTSAVRAI